MWIDLETLSVQQRRKLEYIVGRKEVPKIKVKLLNENCEPARTHAWDAGWDLKSTERVVVPEGQVTKVHTGVIMEIPPRHCGLVVPRSSFGTKYRVTLANDIGVIDSEYRGEILVFLANDGNSEVVIDQFERFAQLIIVPINQSKLWVVDKLSETDRGTGGFGSTTEKKVDEVRFDMADDALYLSRPELKDVPLVEYLKMKNDGTLKDIYPNAVGDMNVDLCQ